MLQAQKLPRMLKKRPASAEVVTQVVRGTLQQALLYTPTLLSIKERDSQPMSLLSARHNTMEFAVHFHEDFAKEFKLEEHTNT